MIQLSLKAGLGIEVRGNDLVMVCLKRGLRRLFLAGSKIIADYRQFSPYDLRNEVQAFVKAHGISSEGAVLGVPRSQIVVRFLELPAEAAEDLAQVVRYQVESFTPAEEEPICYDFALLGRDERGKLVVLVAMMRRADLERYLQLLSGIGLKSAVIQPATTALSNLLLEGYAGLSPSTHLLYHLDEGCAELLAFKDKQLVYSRQFHANGIDGLLGEGELALSALRIEGEPIEKILLTGSGAAAVEAALRERIGECEMLGASLSAGEFDGLRAAISDELTVAAGLALAGLGRKLPLPINLLPQEMRVHHSVLGYIPTILISAAILLLGAGLGLREFLQERALLGKLDLEIAALKPQLEEVNRLMDQARALESEIALLEGAIAQRDPTLEILKELTATLPDHSYLQTVTIKGDELNMIGLSDSATQLLPLLEKSPYLRDVEFTQRIIRDPQSGKERFYIRAKVEKGR